jgi:hypothetical protein
VVCRQPRGLPDHLPNDNDELLGVCTPSGQVAVLAEEGEAVFSEDKCCYLCGKSPCEWFEFGLHAVQQVECKFLTSIAKTDGFVMDNSSGEHIPNKNVQPSCYRMFIYEKYGHLVCGNKIKLPDCVEVKIKELCPDMEGSYTNFQVGDSVSM